MRGGGNERGKRSSASNTDGGNLPGDGIGGAERGWCVRRYASRRRNRSERALATVPQEAGLRREGCGGGRGRTGRGGTAFGGDVSSGWDGGADPHGARIGDFGIPPESEAGCVPVWRIGIRVSRGIYRLHHDRHNGDPCDSCLGGFAGGSCNDEHDDIHDGHRRIWFTGGEKKRMQPGGTAFWVVYSIHRRNLR